MTQEKKELLVSWYRTLGCPAEYEADLHIYLETVELDETATAETYEEQDGAANIVHYLYFCEQLKQRYIEKGISLNVLYDSLQELFLWTRSRSNMAGKLSLTELWWVKKTLTMKLFRLGRLNFCMGEEEHDLPQYGLPKGAPIMEVHIPRGDSLKAEDCAASFSQARAFFATFFPEFSYQYFTCFSWLLDGKLKELLSEESNILRFAALFNVVLDEPSAETIRYVFGRGVTAENIGEAEAKTGLAKKVQERVLSGETFYESYGIIKK